jgi:hypothetical protein
MIGDDASSSVLISMIGGDATLMRFSVLSPPFASKDVFFFPAGSMVGGERTSLISFFLVLLFALEDVFFLPACLDGNAEELLLEGEEEVLVLVVDEPLEVDVELMLLVLDGVLEDEEELLERLAVTNVFFIFLFLAVPLENDF